MVEGCIKLQVVVDSCFDVKNIEYLSPHKVRAWFPATDSIIYSVVAPIDTSINLD